MIDRPAETTGGGPFREAPGCPVLCAAGPCAAQLHLDQKRRSLASQATKRPSQLARRIRHVFQLGSRAAV